MRYRVDDLVASKPGTIKAYISVYADEIPDRAIYVEIELNSYNMFYTDPITAQGAYLKGLINLGALHAQIRQKLMELKYTIYQTYDLMNALKEINDTAI